MSGEAALVARRGSSRCAELAGLAGSGSFDPLVGLAYSLLGDPLPLHGASVLIVPSVGHYGARGGPSLRASVFAQYQRVRSLRSTRRSSTELSRDAASGFALGVGIAGG